MRTVWLPAMQVVAAVLMVVMAPAVAQSPAGSPQALLQQSVEFLKANQPERALPLLQQAVTLDPNNAAARALFGQLLLDSGQPVQALAQLEVAARLRPLDSPTIFNLGVAQLETGRADKAFETLTRLAAREPGELATRSYLARAALRLKKYEAARANLAALRQLAPKAHCFTRNWSNGVSRRKARRLHANKYNSHSSFDCLLRRKRGCAFFPALSTTVRANHATPSRSSLAPSFSTIRMNSTSPPCSNCKPAEVTIAWIGRCWRAPSRNSPIPKTC